MSIPHIIEPEPDPPHRVLRLTAEDAATLLAHLPSGAVERELPGSERHAYLDRLIVKPWGHELRVYDDLWMDVWRLAIEPGNGTSLHAHPRKHTCLICIAGEGELSTGAGEVFSLGEGSVVHIRPGALHATFTDRGMALLEVERPRDKLDLVRIGDRYGRAGEPYEDADSSGREPCPLDPCPAGPPRARLRRHCATGCFRFGVETAVHIRRSPQDLVVAISLATSTVLDGGLTVLGAGAFDGVNPAQTYLTVRSNHR